MQHCAYMAPETLAPGRTEKLDPKEQGRLRVRQLTLESTARTVQGISDDVQDRVEQDITKGHATDMHADEERAYAQGFKKAIDKAGIGQFDTDNTDPSIKAYTQVNGSDSDITFNQPGLADLVDGGDKKVEEATLTKVHEKQHVEDPGLAGTVYVNATTRLEQFDRAEGKGETGSQKIVHGSEDIIRDDAPANYVDAQTKFLDLKEATNGDAEGKQILDGVMNRNAPRRSIVELNTYLWEKGLQEGKIDEKIVEQQGRESGQEVAAQHVVMKHRLHSMPKLVSLLEQQPSMN